MLSLHGWAQISLWDICNKFHKEGAVASGYVFRRVLIPKFVAAYKRNTRTHTRNFERNSKPLNEQNKLQALETKLENNSGKQNVPLQEPV